MAARRVCARETDRPRLTEPEIRRKPRRTTERGFLFVRNLEPEPEPLELGDHENRRWTISKLDGLIPAVVQDHKSGEVLMVGFMNEEAWDVTRRTGYVTFFSRTRNKLWTKGETSGNRLAVRDVLIDCDEDTRARQGRAPRRRQRLPHGRAHLLLSARRRA